MTEVKHGHGLVWAAALLACLLGACSSQESKVLPPVALAETRCPAESKMVMASTNDYGRSFIARLSKQLSYPTEALAEGQIGDVHLCVRVSRDGAIQEGRVLLGSGYPALDGAALQALGVLRQSKESAPVPKDVGSGKEVWLALTVRFDPDNAGLQQGHSAPDDRPCKITGTDEGDAGMQKLSMREWGEFPRRFSEAVRGHLIYPAVRGAGPQWPPARRHRQPQFGLLRPRWRRAQRPRRHDPQGRGAAAAGFDPRGQRLRGVHPRDRLEPEVASVSNSSRKAGEAGMGLGVPAG